MSAPSEGDLQEAVQRPPDRLVLRVSQAADLVARARAGLPDEVCGFLAGVRETVEEIVPVTNAEPSPVCYLMHSGEQFQAMKMMREKGLKMVGIYHSHPLNQAYPSARDVAMASYSDCAYLIVGLGSSEPEMRGFQIENGVITEIPVVVCPDQKAGI